MELSKMGKAELRAACKEQKIKNYSKLTVAGMREALTKLAAPVAKSDPEPRTPPVEQNGVRAPIRGICADVWTACDDWLATTGSAPKAADMRELAEKRQWNQNNASIEVSRWRKFHGHTRPAKTA